MEKILAPIIKQLSAERARFPLWIPVWLGTGMGIYFALFEEPPLVALFAPCIIAIAAVIALRHHFLLRSFAMVLLLIFAGALIAGIRTQMVSTPIIYGELFFRNVEGRIDDMEVKEKGRKLILADPVIADFPASRNPKRLSVTLKKDDPSLRIGDKVRLKAMLFAPPTAAMPGGFDFTRVLFFKGLGAVGFSPSEPELIEKGAPRHFEEALNTLRLSLAERMTHHMSPENAPVAAAIMVGEQAAVSEEVSEAMRDSGIYHVLSISGLHMTLAAGLLFFMVRFLFALWPPLALRLPVKKLSAMIGLLGAFAYLLLAGYPVPAVRSFVMVACVMIAVMFDRRGISLYSLAWAAVIVLLWQPESIFSASFHLSFAATLAILTLYERYSPTMFTMNAGITKKIFIYFFGLMATSLVATLVTTPLVITHFNRFTIWGVAANMLMMPLASFWIMPAAVASFLAMPFGLEHWPLVWLDYGIGFMIAGAKLFASLPLSATFIPSLTFGGIVIASYGVLWLCIWQKRWRWLGGIPVLIGMSTIMLHQPYDMLINDDGTKIALRLPDDRWMFIRGKDTSFDGSVWMRAHGKKEGMTRRQAVKLGIGPECDRQRCIIESRGKRIIVGLAWKRAEGICEEKADILISDAYLYKQDCSHIPLVMDKRFLSTNGAIGIRFMGGEVVMDTADSYRGNRPWVSRRDSRFTKRAKPL